MAFCVVEYSAFKKLTRIRRAICAPGLLQIWLVQVGSGCTGFGGDGELDRFVLCLCNRLERIPCRINVRHANLVALALRNERIERFRAPYKPLPVLCVRRQLASRMYPRATHRGRNSAYAA